MINPKYYSDIASFPLQFQTKRDVKMSQKSYDRVIVCGMWGSSLWVDLVNDCLVDQWVAFQLEAWRGYGMPPVWDERVLFVVCSYSGNTEEVLDAHDHIMKSWKDYVVITAWGKLLERAKSAWVALYQIEAVGMQPKLCTWYFIAAINDVLVQIGILEKSLVDVFSGFLTTSQALSHRAKQRIKDFSDPFVPIVYTDQTLGSMARICKIKWNENAKIPSFSWVVPEMCHNELSGWMTRWFDPTLLLIDHARMHPRNRKRMQVMQSLLEKQWYATQVIYLESESMAHQVIELTMLTDYMTYRYSDARGVDPEPVKIIEDFKAAL